MTALCIIYFSLECAQHLLMLQGTVNQKPKQMDIVKSTFLESIFKCEVSVFAQYALRLTNSFAENDDFSMSTCWSTVQGIAQIPFYTKTPTQPLLMMQICTNMCRSTMIMMGTPPFIHPPNRDN